MIFNHLLSLGTGLTQDIWLRRNSPGKQPIICNVWIVMLQQQCYQGTPFLNYMLVCVLLSLFNVKIESVVFSFWLSEVVFNKVHCHQYLILLCESSKEKPLYLCGQIFLFIKVLRLKNVFSEIVQLFTQNSTNSDHT